MLQSFVITLREGIEAALAIAIALAYLKRIGRTELARPLFAGLWTAVFASVIGAIVFDRLALNTDSYEGYFMVVGAVLVATLVYWMWRTAKGVKGEIESRLGKLMEQDNGRAGAAMFLFSFLMVGREGIETILMLTGVALNTDQLLKFAGGLLGLAAAVVFGYLFVRGSIKVNLRQFFSFTTAILFLVAAQLLISGCHELSEAHVLPSSNREMALIGPIVNNDAYFFIAILALCAVLFLLNRPPRPQPTAEEAGRAQFRLKVAEYQKQQRTRTAGGIIALVLCLALGSDLVHQRALAQPPHAAPVSLASGVVQIPISTLRDGRLHLFQVPQIVVQGKPLRFLAVRTRPGQFAAAFDRCEICKTTFFYESDGQVICSNCGAPLDISRIGEEGGCNPVPLPSTVRDDYLTISRADLQRSPR